MLKNAFIFLKDIRIDINGSFFQDIDMKTYRKTTKVTKPRNGKKFLF